MLNNIFNGIFDTGTGVTISLQNFLLCLGVSLLIGLILAMFYMYKSKFTKSFVVTLAIIPAVVCVIIMLVNGNIGTGVAVAGAFSLVRFRSVPGTAKEIGAIFLAMGAGLATGMGYLAYGFLFALIVGLVNIIYVKLGLGTNKNQNKSRVLKITIPEDLNYTEVFNEIFLVYTNSVELVNIKTTNMGSLFKLTYDIELKNSDTEKEFIDELRCRNGNLEIVSAKQETAIYEL